MKHLNKMLSKETMKEKLDYCFGCFCFKNEKQSYRIQSDSLKTIFQVDSLYLCCICIRVAQKSEQFIRNVQNNQMYLEKIQKVTRSATESIHHCKPLINLSTVLLDAIDLSTPINGNDTEDLEKSEYTVYSSQTGDVKLECKLEQDSENFDSDNFEDNDYQESSVKEESLLECLKEENKEERLLDETAEENLEIQDNINLKQLKKTLKKRKLRKKAREDITYQENGLEKKQDYQNHSIKEEYLLVELTKEDTEECLELSEDSSDINMRLKNILKSGNKKKSKVRKAKDVIKYPENGVKKRKDRRVKMIHFTREQCMKERNKMREDSKYLNCMYKCVDCIKGFSFKDSYEKHMEEHSEAMGEYECDVCKKRMDSADKLLRHQKYHELRYKCTECGLVRKTRLTIKDHYAAFHLQDSFQYHCQHCKKLFKRQVSLRKHIAYSHRTQKRVNCQYCLKSYANQDVLKSHIMRKHSDLSGRSYKAYVCQECGAGFKAPSHLKNHMTKHSGRRDYYCVECDMRFKTDGALKRHLKIAAPHVNYLELPYQCDHCERRFGVKRDLERHLNRVHLNIKPYQCDKCDRLPLKEELPRKICYPCVNTVHEIYSFHQQITQNEIMLQQKLNDIVIENKTVIDSVKQDNDSDCNDNEFSLSDTFKMDEPAVTEVEVKKEVTTPDNTTDQADKNINDNDLNTELNKTNKENLKSDRYIEPVYEPGDEVPLSILKESKNKLIDPTITKLVKSNKFTCLTCFDTFETQLELLRHYQHIELEKFDKNNKELNKQIKEVKYKTLTDADGSIIYKCDRCYKKYKNIRYIDRHVQTHIDKRPYLCKLCGKTYQTAPAIVAHGKMHMGQMYTCSCGYQSVHKHVVSDHEKRHRKEYKYTCPTCGKGFQVKTWYQQHQNIHNDVKPFTCDLCGKTFHLHKYLMVHKSSVHPQSSDRRPWLCKHCYAPCDSKNSLVLHMKKSHGICVSMPTLCDICGKVVRDSQQLKEHKRAVHLQLRPHSCSVCNKKFQRKSTLRVHEQTHTGKRYLCNMCDRMFTRNDTLQRHLKNRHTDSKKKCTNCEKVFPTKLKLAAHQKDCTSTLIGDSKLH